MTDKEHKLRREVAREAVLLRPRYEGANIRTWIGFKHLMYLVEEAVLGWFRRHSIGPSRLYHEYGLGLEIVDCLVLLTAPLELDEVVVAEIAVKEPGRFAVQLRAQRGAAEAVLLNAKVSVAFVREAGAAATGLPSADIAPLVVRSVAAAAERCRNVPTADHCGPSLLWSWRARYFHCHYSDRVQHSAYVRALEEVVDRFLTERGISIRRMLNEKGLIPVVSRARVSLVADAHMDEVVDTTFAVDEIVKTIAYNARMECHVNRKGTRVHTATARILQGYAISRGAAAGRLTELDDATLAALRADVLP